MHRLLGELMQHHFVLLFWLCLRFGRLFFQLLCLTRLLVNWLCMLLCDGRYTRIVEIKEMAEAYSALQSLKG